MSVIACKHEWRPFWDGSRYCGLCEETTEPTEGPTNLSPASARRSEAQQWAQEVRDAKGRPLTESEVLKLERDLSWSWAQTVSDGVVRRLISYARASRSGTDPSVATLHVEHGTGPSLATLHVDKLHADIAQIRSMLSALACRPDPPLPVTERERDAAVAELEDLRVQHQHVLALVANLHGPRERERLALRALLDQADAMRLWIRRATTGPSLAIRLWTKTDPLPPLPPCVPAYDVARAIVGEILASETEDP